jgi:O-antigen/teichoic acid export membrane protein
MSFGKWILASTALSFVSSQSDRLVLGYYMGVATLGVYNIAMFLSEAVGSAVGKITTGVLYPVFSRIQRESPQRMREIYYRTRLRIDIISLIPIGALFILSGSVVRFLYDARYWEAGWMMQLLCIRVAMGIVLGPMETCLFSMGHTRYGLYRNIGKVIWTLSGIPIGYYLYGINGVVWVIALSEIPVLIILWVPFSRIGLLRPSREIVAVLIFGIGLLLGLAIDSLLTYATPYIHHKLR